MLIIFNIGYVKDNLSYKTKVHCNWQINGGGGIGKLQLYVYYCTTGSAHTP